MLARARKVESQTEAGEDRGLVFPAQSNGLFLSAFSEATTLRLEENLCLPVEIRTQPTQSLLFDRF